jgi:acyl dehydratase
MVFAGDRITCSSKVSRKVDRGGLRLMSTDITVTNQDGKTVLTGKVGFVLLDMEKISG